MQAAVSDALTSIAGTAFDRTHGECKLASASVSGTVTVLENQHFRWLEFGDHVVQSCMDLREPARLVLPYTRWLCAPLLLEPEPRRVLVLGLGGGCLVRFHALRGAQVTVVDIDAIVIEAFHRYFCPHGTPLDSVTTLEGDASVLCSPHAAGLETIRETTYDLIVCDLFVSGGMPAFLTRAAFYDGLADLLSPGGWLALNLSRTDTALFDVVVSSAETVFEGRFVRLPVPELDNVIGLATTAPGIRIGRAELDDRAARLAASDGLEFRQIARALYACAGARGVFDLGLASRLRQPS